MTNHLWPDAARQGRSLKPLMSFYVTDETALVQTVGGESRFHSVRLVTEL